MKYKANVEILLFGYDFLDVKNKQQEIINKIKEIRGVVDSNSYKLKKVNISFSASSVEENKLKFNEVE